MTTDLNSDLNSHNFKHFSQHSTFRQISFFYNNKSCATRNFNTRELKNRPSTAQLVSGGGNLGDHPLSLSVAPRVKPEAESIHKKNRGTLTQIYAEYNSVISKNKDLTRTDPDKQIQNRKQNDAMKGPIMTRP